MHRITDARALEFYRIWIRFDNGIEGEVDLSDLVGKGVFASWEDSEYFARVFVHPESRTVTWPDGVDLDPDVLYQDVLSERQPA